MEEEPGYLIVAGFILIQPWFWLCIFPGILLNFLLG